MRRFAHVAAVLAAATAVTPVVAADFSAAPQIDMPSVIPPEEIGTGWYLRGDIGYDRASAKSVSTSFPDLKTTRPSVGRDISYGGGFGYKFNEWFRADVTADYSDRSVAWRNAGCLAGVCANWRNSHATLTSIPILANAYLDMGNWSGITPYVGAGVGFAVTKLGGAGWNGRNAVGTWNATTHANSQTSLAAAVMAGASYTVGSGLMLDVGYRYLWIDQAKIGRATYTDATGATNTTRGNVGTLKTMDFQQFRVGLRYFVY